MKKLFFNNGKAYLVLREIPHSNLIDKNGNVRGELFNAWKEHLGADHVLKTSTHFLYCETVQDVEWEELPNEEDADE